MIKDEGSVVDGLARVLSVLSLLVSICSASIAGLAAWTGYKSRADAAERVSMSIILASAEQKTETRLATDALSGGGRIINVIAEREIWDVLISNTSLSADMTIIGIWPGQKFTPIEPISDELSEIKFKLADVSTFPLTLGPSKTTTFRLVTDIPKNSGHVPFVQISTSRGGQFIGTPTPKKSLQ
jgi:hypothetical protein